MCRATVATHVLCIEFLLLFCLLRLLLLHFLLLWKHIERDNFERNVKNWERKRARKRSKKHTDSVCRSGNHMKRLKNFQMERNGHKSS